MRRNEHSSPNAPMSFLSPSFSAVSPPHLEVPPPLSHDNALLAPGLGLRTPTCKSSRQGLGRPCLPSPTSSQQRCGTRSIASQQRDAELHRPDSRLSALPCGKPPRTQIRRSEVEIVQRRATKGACRCKA